MQPVREMGLIATEGGGLRQFLTTNKRDGVRLIDHAVVRNRGFCAVKNRLCFAENQITDYFS